MATPALLDSAVQNSDALAHSAGSGERVFSIITIVWNNLPGLRRTAESLRHQDASLFEWIIVDGASTDGTVEAISEFSDLKPVFSSAKDDGLYDAMNKGLQKARGDFVLFLNGDDTLLPNALTDVAQAMGEAGYPEATFSMICGGVILRLPNGRQRRRDVLDPARHLWHRAPTSHQAIFFRREDHLQTPHDLSYRVSSDYYTMAAIYKRSPHKPLLLDFPTSETPIGGVSFSSRYPMTMLKDHHRVQTEVLGVPFIPKWLSLGRKAAIILVVKCASAFNGGKAA